jgi:hypothetical protein
MQYLTDVFILNVGRGSCAVIAHPGGRKTMIDINNGRELRPIEREALLAEGLTGSAVGSPAKTSTDSSSAIKTRTTCRVCAASSGARRSAP